MGRFFFELRLCGYGVDEIEPAIVDWSRELGLVLWFYNPRVLIVNCHDRGKVYEPLNSVALAKLGPLQMELIQIRNDAPSMYADFLKAGHKGLQHVAYWTEDYDADLSRLEAEGFKPVMSGEVGARGRFVYFDTEYHPGTVLELAEVSGPKGKLFDLIRAAAKGWDRRVPMRPFPGLTKI